MILTRVQIPLPHMPLFIVALKATQGNYDAQEIHSTHMQLLDLCGTVGIRVLSVGADGAKSEFNAQLKLLNMITPTRLKYINMHYSISISAPIFPKTGPCLPWTDPPHFRKTV